MLLDEIKQIRSTNKDLRKFGFTVGLVLGLIGSVLLWWEKESFLIFLILGGTLTALGSAAPVLLKPVQRVWMTLAVMLGWVMTRVILNCYFILS